MNPRREAETVCVCVFQIVIVFHLWANKVMTVHSQSTAKLAALSLRPPFSQKIQPVYRHIQKP